MADKALQRENRIAARGIPIRDQRTLMVMRAELYHKVVTSFAAAPSFERLRNISFLGLLSPKFDKLSSFPIKKPRNLLVGDGSRAAHSVKVALLAAKAAGQLMISDKSYRYMIAWGLIHDIATWPLSHTGEAAFSSTTGISAGKLRSMMIFGSSKIDRLFHLNSAIKQAGLDHDTLDLLFSKKDPGFSGDVRIVHKLIHSIITPDTLEGMARSRSSYGLDSQSWEGMYFDIQKDILGEISVPNENLSLIVDFWKSKSQVYNEFINKPQTIEFESAWSKAISEKYYKLTLNETFHLTENEIIEELGGKNLKYANKILRYKDPLVYCIDAKNLHALTKKTLITTEELGIAFFRSKLDL